MTFAEVNRALDETPVSKTIFPKPSAPLLNLIEMCVCMFLSFKGERI